MGAQASISRERNKVWAEEASVESAVDRCRAGKEIIEGRREASTPSAAQQARSPRGALFIKRGPWTGSPDTARDNSPPDVGRRREVEDSAEYRHGLRDHGPRFIGSDWVMGTPDANPAWQGAPVTEGTADLRLVRAGSRRGKGHWRASTDRLNGALAAAGAPGGGVDAEGSEARGANRGWRVGRQKAERAFSQLATAYKPHYASDFLRSLPVCIQASLSSDKQQFFAAFAELAKDVSDGRRTPAGDASVTRTRLEAWGAAQPPLDGGQQRPPPDDRRTSTGADGPANTPGSSHIHLSQVETALQGRLSRLNHSTHPWLLPEVPDLTDWEASRCSNSDFDHYKEEALSALRDGKVVFHVIATIGAVTGACPFLSECDPHLLAEGWGGDRGIGMQLRGIPLAQRHLCALAAGVERYGGIDGMRRCKLAITVDVESETALLTDLRARAFYGFDPDNIVVLLHMKAFGFSVDPAASAVARDETSPALPLGPGIDLEQLSWGGESYGVTAAGRKVPLPPGTSSLVHFVRLGALLLTTSRVDDVHKLDSAEAVSIPALANLIRVVESGTASCLVEVEHSDDLSAPHGLAVRVPSVPQPSGLRVAFASHSVIVVPREACLDAASAAAVKDLHNRGSLFAPTDRWSFCLPSLAAALATEQESLLRTAAPALQACLLLRHSSFRSLPAALEVDSSSPQSREAPPVVRPFYRVGDLTYSSLRCSAFQVAHTAPGLSEFQRSSRLTAPDVETLRDALIRAVALQDADATFVGVALRLAPATAPVTVVSPLPSNPMLRIVFFTTHESRTDACLADSIRMLHTLLAKDGTDTAQGVEEMGFRLLHSASAADAAPGGAAGGSGLGRPISARVIGGPSLPPGMGFELRYAQPQQHGQAGPTLRVEPGEAEQGEPPTSGRSGPEPEAEDCEGSSGPSQGGFGLSLQCGDQPWPDPVWVGHLGSSAGESGDQQTAHPAPLFGLVSASQLAVE